MASLQDIAQQYVALVLAVGPHDPDYVDAYYGPPAWKAAFEAQPRTLTELGLEVDQILRRLGSLDHSLPAGAEREALMSGWRKTFLIKQLGALRTHLAGLQGLRLPFDEESVALYDAAAPARAEGEFQVVVDVLDRALPGAGTVLDRYVAFRSQFIVPPERLSRTFEAAIGACRERTVRALPLPASEAFTLEFVTGKSWSGYNWYQGQFRSLIQVNTDLPVHIDRALDLAAHEGYPGHHVHNVLLEQHLVGERGWMEFTVYPLFSPQSLVAEGIANCAADMAFPAPERLAFERDVLFPLAGLDPSTATRYATVSALVEKLSHAGTEAARRLLDGRLDDEGAVQWLEEYALHSRPRAEQRVRFIRQYRSYVINYTRGRELVEGWLARTSGEDRARRWANLGDLMSSPRLASSLQ
ncbi:MAG: hypothetical protein HOP14_06750 [Acidobacteria bacterium]|nr:hypothetical protein [Acidobacteriota bacterium]